MLLYNQEREREIKKGKVETMTRVEREKRIERLENRLFLLNMVDRWTNEDRENVRKIETELRELKEVAQIERKGGDNDSKRVNGRIKEIR